MHCRIWCSVLVVMAVVVWSWDAGCVHCEGYCSIILFDNKHQISCILLVSLSSPYVHDARSQEPKILLNVFFVNLNIKVSRLTCKYIRGKLYYDK